MSKTTVPPLFLLHARWWCTRQTMRLRLHSLHYSHFRCLHVTHLALEKGGLFAIRREQSACFTWATQRRTQPHTWQTALRSHVLQYTLHRHTVDKWLDEISETVGPASYEKNKHHMYACKTRGIHNSSMYNISHVAWCVFVTHVRRVFFLRRDVAFKNTLNRIVLRL